MTKIEVNKAEYDYLSMCRDALYFFAEPKCVCPSCKEALILKNYTCFNCGYALTE